MGCRNIHPKDEFEIQRIKVVNLERRCSLFSQRANTRNEKNNYDKLKAKYEFSKELIILKNELLHEFKLLEEIFNKQEKTSYMSIKEKKIKMNLMTECRNKINQHDFSNHSNVIYN